MANKVRKDKSETVRVLAMKAHGESEDKGLRICRRFRKIAKS